MVSSRYKFILVSTSCYICSLHLKCHGDMVFKCGHCLFYHWQKRTAEKHVAEHHPDKKQFVRLAKFSSGWDLAEWLERLTANAVVATVLGSIPASSDTVESEGRQMKQCWISYIKEKFKKKIPLSANSAGSSEFEQWKNHFPPITRNEEAARKLSNSAEVLQIRIRSIRNFLPDPESDLKKFIPDQGSPDQEWKWNKTSLFKFTISPPDAQLK